jgi:hypothetical protein
MLHLQLYHGGTRDSGGVVGEMEKAKRWELLHEYKFSFDIACKKM